MIVVTRILPENCVAVVVFVIIPSLRFRYTICVLPLKFLCRENPLAPGIDVEQVISADELTLFKKMDEGDWVTVGKRRKETDSYLVHLNAVCVT